MCENRCQTEHVRDRGTRLTSGLSQPTALSRPDLMMGEVEMAAIHDLFDLLARWAEENIRNGHCDHS
jgi:hypothetical protein